MCLLEGCRKCNSAKELILDPINGGFLCRGCIKKHNEDETTSDQYITVDTDVVNSYTTMIAHALEKPIKAREFGVELALSLATMLDTICEKLDMDPMEVIGMVQSAKEAVPMLTEEEFKQKRQ